MCWGLNSHLFAVLEPRSISRADIEKTVLVHPLFLKVFYSGYVL